MSEIKNWCIVTCNSETDGVDAEYVRGTKEQVVDYVKEMCFDCLDWGDEAEHVSFGEVDNESTYRCCVQFSSYHVEISARENNPTYLSLEGRDFRYKKYEDYGGLNYEKTELYYRLRDSELTAEEAEALLQSSYADDLIDLFDKGMELAVYDSLEDCGNCNSGNDLYDEEDTDESFGVFLVQNYKDNSSGCESLCILLNSGRVIQASS